MNLRTLASLAIRLAAPTTGLRPCRLVVAAWLGGSAALALAALPPSPTPAAGNAASAAGPMIAPPASSGPDAVAASAPHPRPRRSGPNELSPRDRAMLERMVTVAGLSDVQQGQIKELMLLAHPPRRPRRGEHEEPSGGAPRPDARHDKPPRSDSTADAEPGRGSGGHDGWRDGPGHPRKGRRVGLDRREFRRALKTVFTPEQWAKFQAARAADRTSHGAGNAAPAT